MTKTAMALNTPTALNKRQSIGSNQCPKCETPFKSNTKHLECSVCELKYCTNCIKILPASLEALKEETNSNFKWTCNGCTKNFPCMTNLANQLSNIKINTNTIKALETLVWHLSREPMKEISSFKTKGP